MAPIYITCRQCKCKDYFDKKRGIRWTICAKSNVIRARVAWNRSPKEIWTALKDYSSALTTLLQSLVTNWCKQKCKSRQWRTAWYKKMRIIFSIHNLFHVVVTLIYFFIYLMPFVWYNTLQWLGKLQEQNPGLMCSKITTQPPGQSAFLLSYRHKRSIKTKSKKKVDGYNYFFFPSILLFTCCL